MMISKILYGINTKKKLQESKENPPLDYFFLWSVKANFCLVLGSATCAFIGSSFVDLDYVSFQATLQI